MFKAASVLPAVWTLRLSSINKSNEAGFSRRKKRRRRRAPDIDAMIALMIPREEWALGRLLHWHLNRVYRYRAKPHPALLQVSSPAKGWGGIHQDLIELRWESERRKLKRWEKLNCISGYTK